MPDRNETGAMCAEETHRPFLLTPRQLEVLTLASEGLTLKGMGNRLSIKERTIRKHLHDIREKLNATNTTHAVAIGVATNLIQVPNLEQIIKQKPLDYSYL